MCRVDNWKLNSLSAVADFNRGSAHVTRLGQLLFKLMDLTVSPSIHGAINDYRRS